MPADFSGSDTLRVSCTGALSVAQWLVLVRAAGESGATVLDRGWCEGCESGGQTHPASCNVSEANALLAATGFPEIRHIR
ncbi:hypothetical protein V6O07_11490, partial [Arthrospira platensis SPKY2]